MWRRCCGRDGHPDLVLVQDVLAFETEVGFGDEFHDVFSDLPDFADAWYDQAEFTTVDARLPSNDTQDISLVEFRGVVSSEHEGYGGRLIGGGEDGDGQVGGAGLRETLFDEDKVEVYVLRRGPEVSDAGSHGWSASVAGRST